MKREKGGKERARGIKGGGGKWEGGRLLKGY